MVMGSPLGGTLSKNYGHHTAALAACALSIIVVICDAIVLPEHDDTVIKEDKKKEADEVPQSSIMEVLSSGSVRDVLLFAMLLGVGLSSYSSMFALGAKDMFSLDAERVGYMMSFSAMIMLFANVFMVGPVVTAFGEFRSMYLSSFVLMLSYLAVCFAQSFNHLLMTAIPIALSTAMLYTVQSSVLSKVVSPSNAGTAMSLSHASRSACGIIAPMVGGYIMKYNGFQGLCLFTSAMAGVSAMYMATVGAYTVGSTKLDSEEA